jgi:hypothetical protein
MRVTVGKAIDQGLVEFSLRMDGVKCELAINEVFEAIDNELSKNHR